MLIITRRVNESIQIGDDIKVTILAVGSQVKIGIEAPREVEIARDDCKKGSREWKRG